MKLPVHLQVLNKSDLESICVNCGLCCYPAVQVAKNVHALIPDLRCKHLQMENGVSKCEVYDQRLEVAKGWCFDLEKAISENVLPDVCPYVKDIPEYVGKTVLADRFYSKVEPQIKKAFASQPMPEWADPAAWSDFVKDAK
jgi:uncharacterized cysteine cluster protein YcgN (CxxCxxCC family)